MTKIYLYTRWTVWFHHRLLSENSSKQKPQRAAFNFFFFKQSSDFLLANSSALSYTCTIPTAGTENCVQVSVCWGCVKTQKKTPCKEEIRFLGWAGDFYLFLEQQSNCCASMDVFFFVSVPVNFFLYGCSGKQIRRAGQTYTKSFNISILVSSLKLQSTELMDFVILI